MAGVEGADGPMQRTLELVQRAQSGDPQALSDLLARYQERVRALVRRRMGARLRVDLDSGDMVQEAMVEVLEGFERFEMRDETAFVRWLSTLVENRLRELARFHNAAKRDRGREVRLDGTPSGERAAGLGELSDEDAPTPSEVVSRRELGDRLAEAIERLSDRHRSVLRARQGDAPWDVVAERLGLPSGAAARMLHARARVALMKRVGEGEGAGGAPSGGASTP